MNKIIKGGYKATSFPSLNFVMIFFLGLVINKYIEYIQ